MTSYVEQSLHRSWKGGYLLDQCSVMVRESCRHHRLETGQFEFQGLSLLCDIKFSAVCSDSLK